MHKKILVIMVIFTLLLSIGITTLAEDQIYSFKDLTVKLAVSKALNKPSGSITYNDLLNVTELGFSTNTNPPVILDDIANMKNLYALHTERCSIVDISPLDSLINLNYLYLSNNDIKDLYPLSFLTNLQTLEIGGDGKQGEPGEYHDLNPLKNLIQLKRLYVYAYNNNDLKIIASIKSLEDISIRTPSVLDYSILEELPNLRKLTVNFKEVPVKVKEASINTANNDKDNIKVSIDSQQLDFDVPPQIVNNRVLVPMRKIFESLGATVEWNEESQSIVAIKDNTKITMHINNQIMTKNEIKITLDAAPTIVNNRTLVPVRAIAECFGANVTWNDVTKTVSIYTTALTNTNETTPNGIFIYQDSSGDKYVKYYDVSYRVIRIDREYSLFFIDIKDGNWVITEYDAIKDVTNTISTGTLYEVGGEKYISYSDYVNKIMKIL